MFFANRNFLGKRNATCGIDSGVTVPLLRSLEDLGDEVAQMMGGFPPQTAFHFLQYESLQADGSDVAKPKVSKSRQEVSCWGLTVTFLSGRFECRKEKGHEVTLDKISERQRGLRQQQLLLDGPLSVLG
jgi:hypothetical protein